MEAADTKPDPVFLRFTNPFMLILGLWVLVQLALEILLALSPPAVRALSILDLAICIVFIADWIVFFLLAGDKRKYAASRFIDLASSVPFVAFLRPLRIFRIIRIFRAFRLLRGLRGVSTIVKAVAGSPARSALAIYPSTTGGRLIAAALVLTGMGLFCLLTAEVATFLLKKTRVGT